MGWSVVVPAAVTISTRLPDASYGVERGGAGSRDHFDETARRGSILSFGPPLKELGGELEARPGGRVSVGHPLTIHRCVESRLEGRWR